MPTNESPKPQEAEREAKRQVTALQVFGEDLSAEARERGGLFVGREREVELVVEALCRGSHWNVALLGPEGIGKHSVLEALAARIAFGEVPKALEGARVVVVQAASLAAHLTQPMELARRIGAVLEEAACSNVVLAVTELPALLGASGPVGVELGLALKAAVVRKELRCILCGEEAHFRLFVAESSSLARSFQPVPVEEPTLAEALRIAKARRDAMREELGVALDDASLEWLAAFADRAVRNVRFPVKLLELVEQVAALASTAGRDAVTGADLEAIATRITGLPADIDGALAALEHALCARALLDEERARSLARRLALTLRGADLRPTRPNAVILALGEYAERGALIAECIAEQLFGGADRVNPVELVISSELGAGGEAEEGEQAGAPRTPQVGLRGLERLRARPWGVALIEGVERWPPPLRALLAKAVGGGELDLGSAARFWLSDAIVLMTARGGGEEQPGRTMGFGSARSERVGEEERGDARRRDAQELVGGALVEQCDFLWAGRAAPVGGAEWLARWLSQSVAPQYQKRGLSLSFDATAIDWLRGKVPAPTTVREWERLLDEELAPLLVGYLNPARRAQAGVESDGELLLHRGERGLAVMYGAARAKR